MFYMINLMRLSLALYAIDDSLNDKVVFMPIMAC